MRHHFSALVTGITTGTVRDPLAAAVTGRQLPRATSAANAETTTTTKEPGQQRCWRRITRPQRLGTRSKISAIAADEQPGGMGAATNSPLAHRLPDAIGAACGAGPRPYRCANPCHTQSRSQTRTHIRAAYHRQSRGGYVLWRWRGSLESKGCRYRSAATLVAAKISQQRGAL